MLCHKKLQKQKPDYNPHWMESSTNPVDNKKLECYFKAFGKGKESDPSNVLANTSADALVDCGRQSNNSRPTVNQQSADSWPTVGGVSTNTQPSAGTDSLSSIL